MEVLFQQQFYIGFIGTVKMSIIPSKLVAASIFDGFKNYQSTSFSVSVPTQNLGAGDFVQYSASSALNNTNSISQVQIQYSGLTSEYLVINGSLTTNWSANNYQIETFYYFSGSTLYVYNVIVNQTGGTITIPNITINCRGFLFIAPF